MFSNTTPLNWYNTLRRLKKEGDFNGYLGKELGFLPGHKAFTSKLLGLPTKHRPSLVISEAAAPVAKKVNRVHKVNKKLQEDVKNAGVLTSEEIAAELPSTPPEPETIYAPPETPPSEPQQAQKIEDTVKRILDSTTLTKTHRTKIRQALLFMEGGPEPKKKISEKILEEAKTLREEFRALSFGGASDPSSSVPNLQTVSPTIRNATSALLSPSGATTRLTPVKSDPQITSEPAQALQSIGSRKSLIPRRAGKKASSVKKVGIDRGKGKAGTQRALFRKQKEFSEPQNTIKPIPEEKKQRRPRKKQDKRTAITLKGVYDNADNAAVVHKYPLAKIRNKDKKEKKKRTYLIKGWAGARENSRLGI